MTVTEAQSTDERVVETKSRRVELDTVLQLLKVMAHSRERALAITKVQEAIMWLGMDLKALAGGKSCYKEGYDPESTTVEPTADGLKL